MNLYLPAIDPVIFSLSIGSINFELRWYAVAYVVGLLIAWKTMTVISRKGSLWPNSFSPINSANVDDLMTLLILGVILGGRLGYVCFYQPLFYLSNPVEIFKVWNGGMSFHGGFIGVVIGTIIYARKNNVSVISLGDLVAVASPPGLFLGRVANFINGELWGIPTKSSLGVLFSSPSSQICPDDWDGTCTRHPSQLYEACLEGILLWVIMLIGLKFFKTLKRKGQNIAIFLIGYGVSRAAVEFFREPDPQFVTATNPEGYILSINDYFGLSMGQLLSAPMIMVGVLILFSIYFVKSERK